MLSKIILIYYIFRDKIKISNNFLNTPGFRDI